MPALLGDLSIHSATLPPSHLPRECVIMEHHSKLSLISWGQNLTQDSLKNRYVCTMQPPAAVRLRPICTCYDSYRQSIDKGLWKVSSMLIFSFSLMGCQFTVIIPMKFPSRTVELLRISDSCSISFTAPSTLIRNPTTYKKHSVQTVCAVQYTPELGE